MNRITKRSAALLACGLAALTLLATPMIAQQTSSDGDTVDLFSEVVDVKVINLEVVVTDRAGNLVSDLEPDDFRLLVDGREVTIDYFSEVREGTAVAGGNEPPGVDAGRQVGTNYLLYVDDNHTRKNERDIVVRNLIDDLERLGPADQMAIVVQQGTGLQTLTRWTNDRVALRSALDRLLDGGEFPGSILSPIAAARFAAVGRGFGFSSGRSVRSLGLADVTQEGPGTNGMFPFAGGLPSSGEGRYLGNPADLPSLPTPRNFSTFQGDDFLLAESYAQRVDLELAMSGALSTLRGFDQPDGRKVMLMLTGDWPLGSFPTNGSTFNTLTELDVVQPLIETANLMSYTLYPINDRASQSIWSTASFNQVARRTGGRALFDRRAVLADAVDDTRSYYWLGFTPNFQGSDQRRRVQVVVERPGVRVRNRNSYLDLSRGAQLAMHTQGALLFADEIEPTGLAVEFGEARPGGFRKMRVPVTVRIPLDELTAIPVGDADQIQLELRFAVVDSTGAQAQVPTIPIILRGDARNGDVFEYETWVTMRRGPHKLMASVYDPATGRMLMTKDTVRYRDLR